MFFRHGPHSYGLRKGNEAAKTWPALAEKWLKKVVTGKLKP